MNWQLTRQTLRPVPVQWREEEDRTSKGKTDTRRQPQSLLHNLLQCRLLRHRPVQCLYPWWVYTNCFSWQVWLRCLLHHRDHIVSCLWFSNVSEKSVHWKWLAILLALAFVDVVTIGIYWSIPCRDVSWSCTITRNPMRNRTLNKAGGQQQVCPACNVFFCITVPHLKASSFKRTQRELKFSGKKEKKWIVKALMCDHWTVHDALSQLFYKTTIQIPLSKMCPHACGKTQLVISCYFYFLLIIIILMLWMSHSCQVFTLQWTRAFWFLSPRSHRKHRTARRTKRCEEQWNCIHIACNTWCKQCEFRALWHHKYRISVAGAHHFFYILLVENLS